MTSKLDSDPGPDQPGPDQPVIPPTDPIEDDGPGWLPAIMAGTILMGIAGFLFCGFSTWLLFQRRTELAQRTIREAYLPEIEQSHMAPQTKQEVVAVVSKLADDLDGGRYENWQSAGILQRLQRVPVLQWARLSAVQAFYHDNAEVDQAAHARIDQDMTRLMRAIELDKTTSFDLHDVLEPVLIADKNSPSGDRLVQPMTIAAAEKVFDRVRLSIDAAGIPDQRFDDIKLADIVQKAIDDGGTEGTF